MQDRGSDRCLSAVHRPALRRFEHAVHRAVLASDCVLSFLRSAAGCSLRLLRRQSLSAAPLRRVPAWQAPCRRSSKLRAALRRTHHPSRAGSELEPATDYPRPPYACARRPSIRADQASAQRAAQQAALQAARRAARRWAPAPHQAFVTAALAAAESRARASQLQLLRTQHREYRFL